jgi:hypothetical protein
MGMMQLQFTSPCLCGKKHCSNAAICIINVNIEVKDRYPVLFLH